MGAAGAKEAFAVGGEGGVMADLDGAIETAFEFGAEIESVEAGEIGWMVENAEGEVDGTGAADADAEEFAGVFVDELTNGGGHVIEDSLGPCAEASGQADGVEAFAGGRDGGDAEVGASEINADGEGVHGKENL
jgi:hypothetical protein